MLANNSSAGKKPYLSGSEEGFLRQFIYNDSASGLRSNLAALNDTKDCSKSRLMFEAAERVPPHAEVIKVLMESKFNPNVYSDDGESLLHRMCQIKERGREYFKILMDQRYVYPGNPDLPDKKGNTVAHEAMRMAKFEIIGLVSTPTNLRMKNNEGRTPLEVKPVKNAKSKECQQALQIMNSVLQGSNFDDFETNSDAGSHVSHSKSHISAVSSRVPANNGHDQAQQQQQQQQQLLLQQQQQQQQQQMYMQQMYMQQQMALQQQMMQQQMMQMNLQGGQSGAPSHASFERRSSVGSLGSDSNFSSASHSNRLQQQQQQLLMQQQHMQQPQAIGLGQLAGQQPQQQQRFTVNDPTPCDLSSEDFAFLGSVKPSKWSEEQVCLWLKKEAEPIYKVCADAILSNGLNGEVIVNDLNYKIDDGTLDDLGLTSGILRKRFVREVEKLRKLEDCITTV